MLTNTRDVDVIADHISSRNQGWQREVTVRTMGHKVRATVYRDAYDFQSVIKVEVWSDAALSWNTVRAISGSDHKGLPSAYVLRPGTPTERKVRGEIFAATADLVDELIAYAQEVLS